MLRAGEQRWQEMQKLDMGLARVVEDYSADLKMLRKSTKTITFYQNNLNLFCRWLSKNGYQCVLGDLSLRAAKSYIVYLEEDHKKWEGHPRTPKRDVSISMHSVRCHVRTLKALSSWLYREEYLPENMLARLKLPSAPKVDIKVLTDEEVVSILSAIDPNVSSGARNYVVILLMLDSGLRMSEVVSLRLSQTDVDHARLWVSGKGSKERLVPIGNRSQRYLRRYITHFRAEPVKPSVDNVFLNRDGTPITQNSIKLVFSRLARRCNIPRLHAHLCRHTFGTNYLKNGGDVFSLQKILGHEDLSTVRMYMHLADADVIQKHRLYSPMDCIDLPGHKRRWTSFKKRSRIEKKQARPDTGENPGG